MNQKRALKFALLVTVALVSSLAFSQNTVTAVGGSTNVTLSTTFLSALQSLNVTAGTVYPTVINSNATANFPISSGAIDLTTSLGNLDHQGGLTLSAGSTTVDIQDFIIDTTGKAPVISGLAVANGTLVGRITLFDLMFPSSFKLPIKLTDKELIYLTSITVTLDASAASTLNAVFNTNAFKAGLSVGTASVSALTIGQP